MSSLSDVARSIEACLTSRSPYCSGTLPVSPQQLVLYYGAAGYPPSSRVDLSNSTPEDLDRLSDACQPATFGVNREDVYDESYRKAGKLDIPNFAPSFDIGSTGLVDIVRDALLDGEDDQRRIKAEMYKLNVYGKDSFFKAHKDTPRGETMFGSLVVVFPTPHQGGEFVLRQDDHEWVVDFAKMISDSAEKPCVGYIAFFSDVEHEVRIVTAGHRVTLTYNLYFIPEKQAIPVISSPAPYEQRLRELLHTLLTNPDLLPEGGYLGFGLRHQYPVQTHMKVKRLQKCLKGNDATLARVLSTLGITWDVRVFYDNHGKYPNYLHKRIVDMGDGEVDRYMLGDHMGRGAEEVTYASLNGKAITETDGDNDIVRKLAKVTDMASMTCAESSFLAWGNEPSLEHLYGNVCIIADLPPSENRTIKGME
ncbi:hypothetical protein PISMIDRAFT_107364 [Pisolithus microcarpus 441]|uniref:Fe2OG dioxygenase domain-containing protein n=1 Tax=Pisolithus microcarpus 441 TaxID=765257 RepID=A0A0C9ZAQ3_9AGAM|nr:hypothetical protein PISMIDRAFT_107364 [Pisolithus microcarpus 441]